MPLYLSEPKVQFARGTTWDPAPAELLKDILQISIEESLHLPAMFSLIIHNSYIPTIAQNKPWRYSEDGKSLFEIGKKIRLGFVSSTTGDSHFKDEFEDFLLEGEITAIEAHFNEKSEAPIIVRGYDLSHRLHRGRYNRSFLNQTDSDIVKKIAKEVGINTHKIEDSGELHEYVFQENQTNMEFLRERAAMIGYELFIQDNKLHFHKPKSEKYLNLEWLKNLSSFNVRVASAEQVSEVEVRSWDYTQKKVISATIKSAKVVTETGNKKGSSASTKFDLDRQKPKIIVVDRPVARHGRQLRGAGRRVHHRRLRIVSAAGRVPGRIPHRRRQQRRRDRRLGSPRCCSSPILE